jgi:hypothetical protein
MSNEYLLPCQCGRTNRVNARQAGETIECTCGTKLDVPTMRELRHLEPVAAGTSRAKTVWGPRQGLAFIGLLTVVLSLGACGYFYFRVMPPARDFTTSQEDLDKTRPRDAWMYWRAARQGIPMNPTGDTLQVLERTQLARRGIRITLGLAVAGLALAASGLLFKPRRA